MPAQSRDSDFRRFKERAPLPICEKCDTPMRIRLTGPEIVGTDKQSVTYVCECGHTQTYVEYLKPDIDFS